MPVNSKQQSYAYTEYRTSINRVAATMLFFYAVFYVTNFAASAFSLLYDAFLVPEAASIASDATSGIAYVFSFMIPVAFFKAIYKRQEYFPVAAEARLPKHLWLNIFAVVGIVTAASVMNSLIMQIFYTYFGVMPDFPESEITGVSSFVMAFITTALIPGFVEEFLFRGLILRNLLPYGKTVALVVSSLMFSLMHQNFMQFFYTFIAGIALGWLFMKTGSIWASVIAHMINNGMSVIQQTLSHYLSEYAYNLLSYAMMIFSLLLCVISISVLSKKEKRQLRTGSVYGKTERIPSPSGSLAVSDKEAVFGFFSPLMITVIALAVLLAVWMFSLTVVPINPEEII